MVDTGDLRAVGLGELNGERADTAGGAVDQHPRPGRHPPLRQVVQRDQAGGGHRRGLLEADPGGLERDPLLGRRGVLRERAAVAPLDAPDGLAEDLVPGPEPSDARPTDCTTPAMSVPGTRSLGRRTPAPIRRSTAG